MTRALKLRIFLGVQLLAFAAWGGWLLASRRSASGEFYLETIPVDPRDMISGTYVALNYDISSPKPCDSVAAKAAGWAVVYVKLEDRGRTAATQAGAVPVYEAVDCALKPAAGYWARATLTGATAAAPRAQYGIERFYVNENDPLKDAKAGSVIAKVRLGRDNRLQLAGLEKKI